MKKVITQLDRIVSNRDTNYSKGKETDHTTEGEKSDDTIAIHLIYV